MTNPDNLEDRLQERINGPLTFRTYIGNDEDLEEFLAMTGEEYNAETDHTVPFGGADLHLGETVSQQLRRFMAFIEQDMSLEMGNPLRYKMPWLCVSGQWRFEDEDGTEHAVEVLLTYDFVTKTRKKKVTDPVKLAELGDLPEGRVWVRQTESSAWQLKRLDVRRPNGKQWGWSSKPVAHLNLFLDGDEKVQALMKQWAAA